MTYTRKTINLVLDKAMKRMEGYINNDQHRMATANNLKRCIEDGLDYVDALQDCTPIENNDTLNQDIETIIKDARSVNALHKEGIYTVRQLTQKDALEVLKMNRLGEQCLAAIVSDLSRHKLYLGMK